MKRRKAMEISRRSMIVVATLAGVSAAMSSSFAGPDETSLEAAVENLRKAMVAKDRQQLEMLCAEDLTYGHSSGKVDGRSEFVAVAVRPTWKWQSLEFTSPSLKVVGGNGLVRVTMTGTYELEGGKVLSINDGVLMVWQKQGALWKLLARQAYKVASAQ
jgi:hypothetical protein